jgi:hypothetical protein
MFRYFKFRAFQNGKVTVGWQSKAQDDQSTCRAEKSRPQSSKYNRDIYFGFIDVLILEKKGLNVAPVRKKLRVETQAK